MSGGQTDLDKLNLDYAISIKIGTDQEKPRQLSLEIMMGRLILRSFLENILPPALLVIVSWVSFMMLNNAQAIV